MKNILNIAIVGALLVLMGSCSKERPTERKVQYMSDLDMYEAIPYETYSSSNLTADGKSAQVGVEGTIARGTVVYEYPNSEEGYQMAKESLKSPLEVNEENMANGEAMYKIYCSACHGNKGDGMGTLVQNEKFLGVPNYKDRDINEGTIYHVIMHGRNLMGSHAGQLTEKERWQVVQYVEQLRTDLMK